MIKKIFYNSLLFALCFVAFGVLVGARQAYAADAGEFVFFRVDTELDVLNDKGITVEWSCNGTASGSITESAGGIASESTQLIDGTVKVASASKEMTDSTCTVLGQQWDGSKTIKGKVSLDGWVTRRWSVVLPASTATPFSTYASMDYTIVVNGIDNELGTVLTLNGTTASATYSGTVASQSYSGGKRYIGGSTSGGTIKCGADGYVNGTTAALTIGATASQSADCDDTQTSTINATALSYGHKIGANFTNRFGSSQATRTDIAVTAGDSNGTTCTAGAGSTNAGQYYCAVPLAQTGVSARGVLGNYTNGTCTYTDRSAGSDAQTTCSLVVTEAPVGGGSGGSGIYINNSATPTPTPSTSRTPTPLPTQITFEVTPTPTPTPVFPVSDACPTAIELIKRANDSKVYAYKVGLLKHITSAQEFNNCNYSWSTIKVISDDRFRQIETSAGVSVKLIRQKDKSAVYRLLPNGVYASVKDIAEFNALGLKWFDVQIVDNIELYGIHDNTTNVKVYPDISWLNVRSGPTIKDKVVGRLQSGEVVAVTEKQGSWYGLIFKGVKAFISADFVK